MPDGVYVVVRGPSIDLLAVVAAVVAVVVVAKVVGATAMVCADGEENENCVACCTVMLEDQVGRDSYDIFRRPIKLPQMLPRSSWQWYKGGIEAGGDDTRRGGDAGDPSFLHVRSAE